MTEKEAFDFLIELKGFKNKKDFAKSANLPYTTLDSMIKRGIGNSSVNNAIAVASTLGIDVDFLKKVLDSKNKEDIETKMGPFYPKVPSISKEHMEGIKNGTLTLHGFKTEKHELSVAHIPLLGYIAAGESIERNENELDRIPVKSNQVSDGDYFFLIVKGDSMIGARIYPGDKVLVKCQPDVETGQIAVVATNRDEATLKRVKKLNGEVMLIAENPQYATQVIRDEEAMIIGRVIRVEFEPK